MTALRRGMAFGQDDALVAQPFEAAGDGGFGEAGAVIEHPAVAGGDPGDHLGERNGISVPLEAEGAPDDVEQHPQLGVAQSEGIRASKSSSGTWV